MKKFKEKGFTLIELIAVLVIMAVLALIVTPLVMNVIRKARVSADKRSIDAYGRSIELAIAGYLLDNGKFPTEVSQLTIEYSGNKVECETTQIKSDSSVYLAGCTVGGRSVEGYTYGSEEVAPTYKVGDEVKYNNVNYYVIKDSDASESTVTLLKAQPLSVEEVNTYGGVGTANNHVNMYNASSGDSYYRTAYNNNGYGGMAYYSSETCGKVNGSWVYDGCTTDYAQSEVKYVVDAWKAAKAPAASEARLIQYDELIENLGYDHASWNASYWQANPEYTPSWVYNSNPWYWTISQYEDSASVVWYVNSDGGLSHGTVTNDHYVVRPVIKISKSAL